IASLFVHTEARPLTPLRRTLRPGPARQSFWPHGRRRYDANTRHDTPERSCLSRRPLRACASRTGACRNWLHAPTRAAFGIARPTRHGAKGASDSEVRAGAAGSPSSREQAISATLWVRRFIAFQHIDQRSDFPRTSSWCLHVGGAKRECIEVLPPQRLKRLPCTRTGMDCFSQIVGEIVVQRAAHRRVRRVPTAIGLRRVHLPLSVRRHAPGLRQPRDVLTVDLTPDALRPARRVSLQIGAFIECLADAIDPSPAQHDVERFRNRDRRHGGALLVDAQPHLTLTCVVLWDPRLERRLSAKGPDLPGLWNDSR